MSARPVFVLRTGLVTSVGLTATASCAAVRAGLTNHTETGFLHDGGEWIQGAQVALEEPWRGREKLLRMLTMAVREALEGAEPSPPRTLPLLLCVAEKGRDGRLEGINDELVADLSREVGIEFHPELSAVIAYGRVGVAVALSRARQLIAEPRTTRVLIAAADSLLNWPTLTALDAQGRLLTLENSNGFIPGEAAGALLIGATAQGASLRCAGFGFAEEESPIASENPLRASGLTSAIRQALADAECGLNDLDFRITDISGEQYYFKEAALSYSRIARSRRKDFDIWHPADCIGETGAAVGVVAVALADASCRKGYAVGPGILFHSGNDSGHRAAVVLQFERA